MVSILDRFHCIKYIPGTVTESQSQVKFVAFGKHSTRTVRIREKSQFYHTHCMYAGAFFLCSSQADMLYTNTVKPEILACH